MDHPCHRCGTAVEDGVAFCQRCGAPQIRVGGGDPSPESPSVPDQLLPSPTSQPRAVSLYSTEKSAVLWSRALTGVALGGLVAAFSMAIPFPTFGLGLLFGGLIAVRLYRWQAPVAPITPGMGARLGVAAGAFGYAIFALLTSAGTILFVTNARVRGAVIETWQSWAASNRALPIDQLIEKAKSPKEFALMAGLSLLITCPIFLLVGSLGGVIAAAVLGKRRNQ